MAEERSTLALDDTSLESQFYDTDDGKYYRRVKGTGEFTPSGFTKDFRVTTMNITDVPTKLPATPLDDRNSLSINNLVTNSDTLYVNKTSSVTADDAIGTNAGWEIIPNGFMNIDIKNNLELWAVAPTGKTIRVKLLELA